MITTLFAAEETSSGIGALGVSLSAFIVQLITFVFVVLILKRFAFKPVIALLDKRRQAIDDSVKLGMKLEKERDKLQEEVAKTVREARHEADRIIANAHKESRDVLRESEKTAQRKVDNMLTDATARIEEEQRQAKRGLEKEIVGLISEATESIVGEKIDATKDASLIDKALKGRNK